MFALPPPGYLILPLFSLLVFDRNLHGEDEWKTSQSLPNEGSQRKMRYHDTINKE